MTAEDNNGAFVAQLQEIKDPGDPNEAAGKQLANELADQTRLDLVAEMTTALRNRFPVKIDQQAVDRMF